jgi:putative heme-binding domain-containing protein
MSRFAFVCFGVAALLLALDVAADQPARTPWVGSKLVGSPDPSPPLKLVIAFPKAKFDHPTLMAQPPGGGRWFVAEQGGKVFSFKPDAAAVPELCFDPAAELKNLKLTPGATHFESTYGLAFHPKFAANRQCFVCYTVRQDGKPNLADGTRVSRFTMTATEPPRVDPASEEILLTFLQGGHNGGDLHFGPDGMLYVTTGDAATPNPPDEFKTGQDVTDLLSSVLRIDVDRQDAGKKYAVPPDNPFVGTVIDGKPARGEVWAYGFRNPWRISFDRKTGELWAGDVGWELWELVDKVSRGGNYGWSAFEGRQPVNTAIKLGPTPITPPAIEIPHTEGASVTGGYVYRGAKFPALADKYVFGDWVTKKVWAATFAADGTPELQEVVAPTVRVVAFGQDAAGELYLLDYDAGTVHTFAANDGAAADPAKFPRTLSATALFADTAKHAVAPGVVKFEINSNQWQDGATSQHFLAAPAAAPVLDYADKKQIPGNVNWNWYRLHFPAGTALVKTITLPAAGPAPPKRIETQILLFDGQFWNGYTYAWRDDQADADLVPADGSETTVTVPDPVKPGQTRQRPWPFAGRSQCQQCHHSWAEHTLAFNPEQLHRAVDTPAGRVNQLVALVAAGVLERRARDEKPRPNYSAEELAKERKLVNPHDAGQPLDKRAQSYLHANCGHCHRFGGGGAVDFELHAFTDWESKKLVNAPPTRGTFDLPDARIIAPGDPGRSTLYYRMAKFGRGRMPHVGSELVDVFGVGLVGRWIASLDGSDDRPEMPPPLTTFDPANIAAKPLDLARAVGTQTAGQFTPVILAAAAKLPDGPRRDLFDGYLADDGRPRRLGTNPRPKAILALTGDADRGRTLFAAERSQCLKCHQLEGKGVAIGPDLTLIGKTRTPPHLLESLLEPSRRVEPLFQAVLVACHDGRTFTGIVTRKDGVAVTLRDAENRETKLKRDDIDTLTPARDSLMPAGLLADFTPQEAADLLAFLAGRK